MAAQCGWFWPAHFRPGRCGRARPVGAGSVPAGDRLSTGMWVGPRTGWTDGGHPSTAILLFGEKGGGGGGGDTAAVLPGLKLGNPFHPLHPWTVLMCGSHDLVSQAG